MGSPREPRSNMGQKVSSCNQILEEQLDGLVTLLRFSSRDQDVDLHDQRHREPQWENQEIHKGKMSFPDDASVPKSVFLALREIIRKWTFQVRNWSLIVNQFINIFGERCKL